MVVINWVILCWSLLLNPTASHCKVQNHRPKQLRLVAKWITCAVVAVVTVGGNTCPWPASREDAHSGSRAHNYMGFLPVALFQLVTAATAEFMMWSPFLMLSLAARWPLLPAQHSTQITSYPFTPNPSPTRHTSILFKAKFSQNLLPPFLQ